MPDRDTAVLDDPVAAALCGPHAHLARRHGRAASYHPDIASISTLTANRDAGVWDDLAELLGADAFALLFHCPALPPSHWVSEFAMGGYQLIHTGPRPPRPRRAADLVELGPADVPEMLALVERTRPGPFHTRTIELGTYLGVRENGALVAMAGERLKPPGWTEISAVCTAPEARGRGHAATLITTLVHLITARGEHPFLHVAADNPALGLYQRLGFEIRTEVTFRGFRTP
ncbi:GNAT family N-acetyltransferase [Kitasatospora sp. CB01950]|uniref:GNAT family N-acetyltransferase n=1 Tax=Kitasatospora sp. CB01950 TaxID=1703930 RepID=UPI00093C1799|nr:GNAT family N-acetyltransferase [Kitasatospora sp. CB01950]OKJ08166.1 acetyltransferase [Kitasatospora sp. CB01950]